MPIRCSNYKTCFYILKYAPITMALVMYIHTILKFFGINLPIATTIAGSAIIPSVIIFSMSKMLKFCFIHKAFTIYSLTVDLCINFENYFGFGDALKMIQFTAFIVGTCLFVLLLCKLKQYRRVGCMIDNAVLKQISATNIKSGT